MPLFKKRRIAVIANPKSGKNTSRAGLAKALGSYLTSPRWVYSPETLQELEVAAADISRERHDMVVVIGGDGTHHKVITRLVLEHEAHPEQPIPALVPLWTGSMNNGADVLGMTKWSAVEQEQRIMAKLASGAPFNTAHLTPLRCNDMLGFTFGAGFPNLVLERYMASGAGGPAGAFNTIMGIVARETASLVLPRLRLLAPVPSSVRLIDGTEERRSPYDAHTIILVGSYETIGLGFMALPDARRHPGKFMVRASTMSVMQMANNIVSVHEGRPLPDTCDWTTARAVISFGQDTRPMIDGDLMEPTREVAISLGPTITFITG